MEYYNWDKVPEDEKQRVYDAVENYDLDDLLDMYYEFELGSIRYCCPFDGMWQHFNDAVVKKLI